MISNASNTSDEDNINDDKKSDQDTSNASENDQYTSTVRNGVEVVDVKLIPKEEITLDKFGIPQRGPRKTWDKI